MKKTTILLSLILSLSLFGKDVIKGKFIEERIPETMPPSIIDLPRNHDVLMVISAIEKADNFLKVHFGKDFKLPFQGISLRKRIRPNGILWCWHVDYKYPQSDKKNKDYILTITLSLEGKPLMSVTEPKN